MDIKWLGVMALWVIIDKVLQKKFSKTWERIQFPFNVIASSLSLICVVFVIVGIYQVAISDINNGEKTLFYLLAIAYIAAFAWGNYAFWREWFKRRKGDR